MRDRKINKTQFQKGLSIAEFLESYGTVDNRHGQRHMQFNGIPATLVFDEIPHKLRKNQ